ncbi:MAG: hypothetical protein H7Y88_11550 [Phycisphaerales bacterium]|nr:hypothetical protein [Phycisphaerales bacterium]
MSPPLSPPSPPVELGEAEGFGDARIDRLVVEPLAGAWEAALRDRGVRLSDRALRFRGELGLPNDRPIVMSGHQPGVWHPGILAKHMGVEAASRRWDAAGAWVVVDQDEVASWNVAYPAVARGERGVERLVRGVVKAEGFVGRDVPALRASAIRLGDVNASPATASVRAGLQGIRGAIERRAGAANAAEQMAGAARELMAIGTGGPSAATGTSDVSDTVRWFMASAIARTGLFAGLIERMRRDARACADAYNAAVARTVVEGVGVQMLISREDGAAELPLWRVGSAMGSRRERVYADMLGSAGEGELLPRGLMMSGVLRLAGCELFVHGLGGGGPRGYDRVTERWFEYWLGAEEGRLAPVATVSATGWLGLPEWEGRVASDADVAAAVWRRHHARHDPKMLGDEAGAVEKGRLLREIEALHGRGERSARAFRAMHDGLASVREGRTGEMNRYEGEVEGARARRAQLDVVQERSWPFALYEEWQMTELRSELEKRMGGE